VKEARVARGDGGEDRAAEPESGDGADGPQGIAVSRTRVETAH